MDKKTYLSIRSELNFDPSQAKLGKHLLADACLIAAITWLLAGKTVWGYAGAQLLLAALYFRGFAMMHEAVHGCLSKKKSLNTWLGVFYGGICFLPYTTWRSVHLEHHSWVGNAGKDPVMKIVREFPSKSESRKNLDTLLWRSWIPYLAFLQEMVFWSASAKLTLEKDKFADKRGELVASVAAPSLVFLALAAAGYFTGSLLALAPSIIIYLALVEIINFPHHLSLPRVVGEGKLSLWNQYKVSRTCIYSPWFSRIVLLHFNYHAEHHMFPTLPWYELAKAHQKVRAAGPQDYQIGHGHEWILANRQKSLKEVFAPTKVLDPDMGTKREAA